MPGSDFCICLNWLCHLYCKTVKSIAGFGLKPAVWLLYICSMNHQVLNVRQHCILKHQRMIISPYSKNLRFQIRLKFLWRMVRLIAVCFAIIPGLIQILYDHIAINPAFLQYNLLSESRKPMVKIVNHPDRIFCIDMC